MSDTGIGISPENLANIWGDFYQVDARPDSGVGLGLAIVDRTSRLLGASVRVLSTLGKGSTFSIEVPRRGFSRLCR